MATHIPITINTGQLQSTASDSPPTPHPGAPSFDTYRNNPVSYAKAAEQYYAGNLAQLYQYLMKQPPEAQKGLLDHSQVLRDYLGIGHPKAIRTRLPQSTAKPLIPYTEAPAALALAAVRVTDGPRADRALSALAGVLEKNQVGHEPDTRDGRDYKKSVETAFVQLLNDFQKLPSDAARRKAIEIIRLQFNQLSSAAKEKICLAVQQSLLNPAISNELKNELRPFDIRPTLPSLPTEIHLNILEKLQDDAVVDASKSHLDIDRERAGRASARAMANVRLASRNFHNIAQRAVNDRPDTGMAITANAIRDFSRLDDDTFRKKLVDLFSSHDHIGVDFSKLSDGKKQIVLDLLSQNTPDHLRNVKFCGTQPTQDVRNALLRMCQNKPGLKVDLDLSGQVFTAGDAAALAGTLRQLQVKALDLSKSHGVGTQDVIAIARVLPQSGLTDLNLSDTALNLQAAAAIATALPQSEINVLKLRGNQGIGSQGAIALAGRLAQSKVTILDMSNTNMGQQGAAALVGVLSESKLKVLDLSDNRGIGPQSIIALAGRLPHCGLTDLSLRGTGIDAQAAAAIGGALPLSHLTKLDLSDNNIGAQGAVALAATLPQSDLTTLNLSRSRIGPQGVTAIAGALAQSKLTSLNLSGCQIDYQAAVALAAALRQSNVTTLDLSSCAIDQQAAAVIAGALAESNVTHLNFSNNHIGRDGAIALAAALPKSKLIDLNLSNGRIGPEGAAALASPLPRSKLERLNLTNNQIGPQGATAIAGWLAQCGLTHLDVSDNAIGHAGGMALAGALPLSKLSQVELKGNALGDAAAIALAAVIPPQKKLDWSRNDLGSDAAIAIANILSKCMTEHLNLSGNRIDRRGARALADALPQSDVTYLDLSVNDAGNQGTTIGDGIAIALARKLQQTKLTDLDLRESFVGYRGGRSLLNRTAQSQISTLGLRTLGSLDTRLTPVANNAMAMRPFTLL